MIYNNFYYDSNIEFTRKNIAFTDSLGQQRLIEKSVHWEVHIYVSKVKKTQVLYFIPS